MMGTPRQHPSESYNNTLQPVYVHRTPGAHEVLRTGVLPLQNISAGLELCKRTLYTLKNNPSESVTLLSDVSELSELRLSCSLSVHRELR